MAEEGFLQCVYLHFVSVIRPGLTIAYNQPNRLLMLNNNIAAVNADC